jgi:hypothetical protein
LTWRGMLTLMPLYELTLHLDRWPGSEAATFSNDIASRGSQFAPGAPGQSGLASRLTRTFNSRDELDHEIKEIKELAQHPLTITWGELKSGRDPYAP